jgi:PAS domain S-box-containing protein
MTEVDRQIRVLHVDEDPELLEDVGSHLERFDDALEVATADSAEAALEALRDGDSTYDCLVSDHEMPGIDGLELLRSVRGDHPDLPVILFTGKGDEELASEAISAGVTEYLQKGVGTDQYSVLATRILEAVGGDRATRAHGDTERKHHEQDLERYRTLVETVGEPMYVLDEAGRFQMVNRALESFLGYDRSALIGETPAVLMPAADLQRGEAVIADLLDQPVDEWTTWECDTIDVGGEHHRTEVRTALIWNQAEFEGSVGVLRDVSHRRAREAELERYGTIIQAVGDPVYALDPGGRFTFVNEAFEATTGYAVAELEGAHMNKVVREEDIMQGREYIQAMLDGNGHHHVFEVELTTKGGEHIPAEFHIALLPSHDGEFRGTAGVIRDIQERKARETRLQEFTSVVSHDLRNPLNVIAGHTEMAMTAEDPDTHLETIDRAAGKMEALIDDLLTLAREGQTVGETEPVQLSEVVTLAWETVEPDGLGLEREADVTLDADPNRLCALFENLFRNATEHAGPGVTVRVGVDSTPEGDRRLYVADDGSGIPESKREEVLDRGYTTSQDGTGFGLAIVHRIADAHGWNLRITKSRSGGARFEFTV